MTDRDDELKQKDESPESGKEFKEYVLNSLHGDHESDKQMNDNEYKETESREEPVRRRNRRQSDEKYTNRKKENNMVKKIVIIISLALIVTVTVAGFSFYSFFKSSLKPLDPSDKKMVQVEVPIGSSSKDIGQILEKSKVIKSGLVFSYFVKMNNLSDFQAGYYQMAPNMTLDEISKNLQSGGTDEPEALADAKITIPEGSSIDQIADLFDKKTDVKKDEFLALMKDEKFFNKMAGKYPELLTSAKQAKDVRFRLEGYLYPATYNYYKDNSLEELVEQMIIKTNQVMTPLYQSIEQKKLSVQEVLTLASLTEKEGVSEEDRKKIAQVFFNRIETDMPLQSDISILYAMEEHKVHLSNKDTQIDSPYNLYIHKGTGPGPFNSPSEQSILAVMNPEANDYIYFLADVSTGKVYYAKTYEEHLKLKKEYIDDKK
ncbi:endolytic transglycosylase MltG [Vagococcus carniphilus]|nr:endolytic transglycosylase MltG [Vagococcus carniphilus]MDT2831403.1 endolytic transglycosylase MltG [Vagococcus carniphilus]MDT2840125.1 endolytic transglycosylase MltG [Vagococcus carniphilus]MDT2849477.1 endolytic transglycosylase MltG [Vagococcus carniphilus]MDT2855052.1 endolytic transglycosylase MltG [Vagococcus carniphilus]